MKPKLKLDDYEAAYNDYYGNKSSGKPSMDMFKAELPEGSQERGMLGNLFGTIKGAGLGAAESALNIPASIGNLIPQALGMESRIPHADFSQLAGPEDQNAYLAGSIAAPGLGKFKALQKLMNIARPAGKAGLISDVGRGAALGYATGENAEHEGRGLGAAFGAGLSALGTTTNKTIADRVAKENKASSQFFRKEYKDLFDEAQRVGAHYTSAPRLSPLLKRELVKSQKSLDKYARSPTLENAHFLQSDLGKDIRALEHKADLPSEKIKALKAARRDQAALKKAIEDSFSNRLRPDLAKRYKHISKSYDQNRVAWKDPTISESISKYEQGKMPAGRFVKKLKGNEAFNDRLREMFPEIEMRQALQKAAKIGIGYGAVPGAALYFGAKKGAEHFLSD